MPPPNITGKLHMGHALFTTLQDISIRFERMRGRAALWLPGCDHAGLATQEKLTSEMIEQGLDPSDDEAFHAFAASYKDRIGGEITEQLRRTGASCDWSRYRYTLDQDYGLAVTEALRICHEKGMLYRDDGQWYLDMTEPARQLLDRMDEIEINPECEAKTLRHFLENIEPWCISRQIQWGHALPIWTRGDEILIADIGPDGWTRERGVLDTWFSSSLWTFATLGWPDSTTDLERFNEAAMIETADDILFFWCARMLMMGLTLRDKLPFRKIFLHGIVRDKFGRKMSKSLNNGIDPLDIIDRFGCDAMRFGLAEFATPGQDTKFQEERMISAKGLRTKLWNAAKYSLKHWKEGGSPNFGNREFSGPHAAMMDKIGEARNRITSMLEKQEYHLACREIRMLIYNDYCSTYIEETKSLIGNDDGESIDGLMTGLDAILHLMHPFMPFVTERIKMSYCQTDLITANW